MNARQAILSLVIIVSITIFVGRVFWASYSSPASLAELTAFTAVFSGIAAFYNPCALPFLPLVIARAAREDSLVGALKGPMGLILFNALVLLPALAFSSVLQQVLDPWSYPMRLFKILLGVLVMVVAVDSLRGRMIASKISRILSRRVAKISGVKPSLFAYGFLYNIVGGGCAIPIIIGLLASSLPLGPINTAFIITIFTITMAVLLAVHVLVPNRITVSVGTRYWPKIVMATYTLQALAGLAILLSGVYPALFMTFI